jgi:hypothetical protein
MTIGELARMTGADKDPAYQECLAAWRVLQQHMPAETQNGRMSYGFLQRIICMSSSGKLVYGGQGKADPDFYYNGNKWGETKSFRAGASTCHVAASSFQASNSAVPKWKKLLEEDPDKAKQFLFENSYDKNDLYCLTGSGKSGDTVLDLEQIELIFVKKEILVKCLISENTKKPFKDVDLNLLRKEVSANVK